MSHWARQEMEAGLSTDEDSRPMSSSYSPRRMVAGALGVVALVACAFMVGIAQGHKDMQPASPKDSVSLYASPCDPVTTASPCAVVAPAPVPAPVSISPQAPPPEAPCDTGIPIPDKQPGRDLILATDVDWPPYAFYDEGTSGQGGGLAGFGKDVGEGVGAVCGFKVTYVQTNWKNCWDSEGYKKAKPPNGKPSPGIGIGLQQGWFHGCSTYTHAQGVRNRFMEFSDAILDSNKPAGLLTLLINGVPKVDGNSNLAGKKVADVGGWVPTADGLYYVVNQCTGAHYVHPCKSDAPGCLDGYTLLVGEGNDPSMQMLRSGAADALFIYADQAYNYECDASGKTHSGADPTWDCALWKGFGTEYAYVQTGQFGHTINGTTLSISKKGSGLAEQLNPCIAKFLQTEDYYKLCKKHDMVATCFKNAFFPAVEKHPKPYMIPTDQQPAGCASGYCGCPPKVAVPPVR